MKKLLIGAAVAVAALFVLGKTTNLFSYTGTIWSQARTEAKRQIPTKFELDRIRHEIANLDGDVDRMIRPVAEYKAVIDRMRRDIYRGEANLADQKKTLVALTDDLKTNHTTLVYGGKRYAAETIRVKLSNDFEAFKRAEAHLTAQRKLLASKESSLKASQEQLLKVINKKKEYELRLAQLEAQEEALQVARIGSDIRVDNSRATQIEKALQDVEDRQSADLHAIELTTGLVSLDGIPVQERPTEEVDVEAIRAYLEGTPRPAKTLTVSK